MQKTHTDTETTQKEETNLELSCRGDSANHSSTMLTTVCSFSIKIPMPTQHISTWVRYLRYSMVELFITSK